MSAWALFIVWQAGDSRKDGLSWPDDVISYARPSFLRWASSLPSHRIEASQLGPVSPVSSVCSRTVTGRTKTKLALTARAEVGVPRPNEAG
jgi:hypothetical protein